MYLKGCTPLSNECENVEEREELIKIAKSYFKDSREEDFMRVMAEGQYNIQLWAAHLMLEYGNLSKRQTEFCLYHIKNYANSPFSKKVAFEETRWLEENYPHLV